MTYGIGKPAPVSARRMGAEVYSCTFCREQGNAGYIMPPNIRTDFIKCPYCGAFFNQVGYCLNLSGGELVQIYIESNEGNI